MDILELDVQDIDQSEKAKTSEKIQAFCKDKSFLFKEFKNHEQSILVMAENSASFSN